MDRSAAGCRACCFVMLCVVRLIGMPVCALWLAWSMLFSGLRFGYVTGPCVRLDRGVGRMHTWRISETL